MKIEQKWFILCKYDSSVNLIPESMEIDFSDGYFEDTARHRSSIMDFYSIKHHKHIHFFHVFDTFEEAIKEKNKILQNLINKKEKQIRELQKEIEKIREIK